MWVALMVDLITYQVQATCIHKGTREGNKRKRQNGWRGLKSNYGKEKGRKEREIQEKGMERVSAYMLRIRGVTIYPTYKNFVLEIP